MIPAMMTTTTIATEPTTRMSRRFINCFQFLHPRLERSYPTGQQDHFPDQFGFLMLLVAVAMHG